MQANSPANSHSYISFNHTTSTNSIIHIDGNKFENMDAHISGDVNFINCGGTMAANAGAQFSVSNNEIVGGYTKSLGDGNVYLFRASGSSGTGNTMVESGNNFSNITLTGNTVMRGWYDNEGATAAGPQKSIANNVFHHWSGGSTGSTPLNVIYCNGASGNSEISRNQIDRVGSPTSVNGIYCASTTASSMKIMANKISGLYTQSSSGESVCLNLAGVNAVTTVQNNMLYKDSLYSGNAVYGIKSTALAASSSLYINYNTIYLRAGASTPTFNSAALYLPASSTSTSSRAYIRNNIFVNNSVPGSSGKAVVFWRSGSALANLDTSCNNNVFYAGSPNAQHLVYFDGNAKQKLNDYQTYLQSNSFPVSMEAASLELLPAFVSVPSAGMGDLHLLRQDGECRIFDGGNNDGIALSSDIDDEIRPTAASDLTDIGADQVIETFTWTGAINNVWGNTGNWSSGKIPNDGEKNVIIPFV